MIPERGQNSERIHVILLISCCFHFWVGQSHPANASIWWAVQQQEQIALLGWSQRMVAANKLLLLSDPCLCVCEINLPVCLCECIFVHLCVPTLVCVTQSDFFQIRKWNPLWDVFFPPSEPFSFITSPALPWATGCAPTLKTPDKHRQHLSCRQKCWVAITSQQTT